jgi:hypothetical protein
MAGADAAGPDRGAAPPGPGRLTGHPLNSGSGSELLRSALKRLKPQATQQAVSGGGREWRRSSAPRSGS